MFTADYNFESWKKPFILIYQQVTHEKYWTKINN